MLTTTALRKIFLAWLTIAAIAAGAMRADAFNARGVINDVGEPASAGPAFFEGVFLALLASLPLLVIVLMLERIATDQAASLARIEGHLGTAPATAAPDEPAGGSPSAGANPQT